MASEYERAVQGEDIANIFGNRVVKSRSSSGRIVAVKVKPRDCFSRSEADMMDFVSKAHPELRAPSVFGCYDIEPRITTMVSELVAGVPLDKAWPTMNKEQRESYIGRIDKQPMRNFYEVGTCESMGPFDSEQEFDKWCLLRVRSPLSRVKWKFLLSKMREKKEQPKFVLTHGDLAARNIIINDGIITGIVDWEHSGFFPEYMEYAAALAISNQEDWWKAVLVEILDPYDIQRLEFSESIKSWGIN